MSTRSNIAFIKPTGEVVSIYCHYDGYYSGVGKALVSHYDDLEKIIKLTNLGNITSLSNYESTVLIEKSMSKTKEYSQSLTYPNVVEYLNDTDCGEEYLYLWDGEWFCQKIMFNEKGDKNSYISLKNKLADIEDFHKIIQILDGVTECGNISQDVEKTILDINCDIYEEKYLLAKNKLNELEKNITNKIKNYHMPNNEKSIKHAASLMRSAYNKMFIKQKEFEFA